MGRGITGKSIKCPLRESDHRLGFLNLLPVVSKILGYRVSAGPRYSHHLQVHINLVESSPDGDKSRARRVRGRRIRSGARLQETVLNPPLIASSVGKIDKSKPEDFEALVFAFADIARSRK